MQKQNFSCVYRIVSSATSESYVGSAKHFGIRRRNHICQLNKKRHHSSILQAHVDLYGMQDLFFEVLEMCPYDEKIRDREQFYMDLYKPSFNKKKNSRGLGEKASPETLEKLRISHLGHKPTQETLEKQRQSMKDIHKTMDEERKDKWVSAMREARKKKVICNETKIIYESIADAERKTGCDNISLIVSGQRNKSKGLTFKYFTNEL